MFSRSPKIRTLSQKMSFFFYRQDLGRLKSCHDDQNRDTMPSFNSKFKFDAFENRVTIR